MFASGRGKPLPNARLAFSGQQEDGEADKSEGELTGETLGLASVIAAVTRQQERLVGQAAQAADQVLDIRRDRPEGADELAGVNAAGCCDSRERRAKECRFLRDVEVPVREHVGRDMRDAPEQSSLGASAAESAEAGADECVDGGDHRLG